MTRGPVHEAYAVPVTAGQTAGLIVPKQPPAPVEEVPPDMKPEGGKATWIPGYWTWDDERQDFIWASGVWRSPPPGYRWMPGYWKEAPGQGYQWISGYWMPAHIEEATYMPQPPQSIETGPTSGSPGANYFWVPGHWQWVNTRYAWQPGYWTACQPDWIWVPATYYWCPRGWVYVPGYWDYPLAHRGLVFAPVYFAGPVPVYRPAVCLEVGAFSVSLFCRPAYCHYYFGDYYGDNYVALGIHPWFYYSSPRFGYDPLFVYYRWYHVEHLGERGWDAHLRGWHDYYRGHPNMRPPRTLVAQRELLASRAGMSRPDIQQLRTAQARDVHAAGGQVGAMRLQGVSQAERAQVHQAARETTQFAAQRQQFERSAARRRRRASGATGTGQHGADAQLQVDAASRHSAANVNQARTQAAGGGSAGRTFAPGGANAGSGRGVQPGGSRTAPNNRGGRDREKKPQASVTPPATTPAVASHPEPNPKTQRTPLAGKASASVAESKPQPQPQTRSERQVRTVMHPNSGTAGQPPPVVAPPPSPPSHAAPPPSHPQPPASTSSGGRGDSRGDDKRARDKDKR